MRLAVVTLGSIFFLHGCGGGDGGGEAPVAEPPSPAPTQLKLDATNYQTALRHSLEWSDSAFFFARLGADVADVLITSSSSLLPVFNCAVSGAASITLTDRNRNGQLNAGDTLSLFMDHCVTDFISATGVMRIEVTSAEALGDGHAYQLLVTIVDLTLTSNSPVDVLPSDINLTASLDYSYTSDFAHYVLTFGDFSRTMEAQTQTASRLVIDYLQRYDAQTYDYLLQGTLAAGGNSGEFRVSTPQSFTGIIGSYPSAGRMALVGAADSTARASEEGAAAGNSAAVLVSVDANGDGVADSEVLELDWTQLVPGEIFRSFRERPVKGVLPIR